MKTVHKELLKSLLPAILFMVVFRMYSYKWAIAVGFTFGAVIYISEYRKRGKLTPMDKLGIFGLITQTILGALASNPKVYFLYPLIENIVFAMVFFGSLFIGREIPAIFAMSYGGDEEAYSMLRPTYRKLTILWSLLFIFKAAIKVFGLLNWSFEVIYMVSWLLDKPLFIGLLWFSFAYPEKVYRQLMAGSSL